MIHFTRSNVYQTGPVTFNEDHYRQFLCICQREKSNLAERPVCETPLTDKHTFFSNLFADKCARHIFKQEGKWVCQFNFNPRSPRDRRFKRRPLWLNSFGCLGKEFVPFDTLTVTFAYDHRSQSLVIVPYSICLTEFREISVDVTFWSIVPGSTEYIPKLILRVTDHVKPLVIKDSFKIKVPPRMINGNVRIWVDIIPVPWTSEYHQGF